MKKWEYLHVVALGDNDEKWIVVSIDGNDLEDQKDLYPFLHEYGDKGWELISDNQENAQITHEHHSLYVRVRSLGRGFETNGKTYSDKEFWSYIQENYAGCKIAGFIPELSTGSLMGFDLLFTKEPFFYMRRLTFKRPVEDNL